METSKSVSFNIQCAPQFQLKMVLLVYMYIFIMYLKFLCNVNRRPKSIKIKAIRGRPFDF